MNLRRMKNIIITITIKYTDYKNMKFFYIIYICFNTYILIPIIFQLFSLSLCYLIFFYFDNKNIINK